MTTQTIPLTRIQANVNQPRKTFDAKLLDELADSILENGLAQPITVRPVEDSYEVVMGERRFRAHQRLVARGHREFAVIEAHVRAMDDQTRDIQAILENLQRVDVTPLEEAQAFQRMIDLGTSKEDLAKKIGRPVWRVNQRLALTNLAPSIAKLCESGAFDCYNAQEIARLPNHDDQIKILKLYNNGTLYVFKALVSAIDAILEGKTQADMFGEAAPKVSEEDVATINSMESKVEKMAALASAGWKNGECIVATKVSRNRARLMAEKIRAMRSALLVMEQSLRQAAAQAEIVLSDAA